MKLLTLKTSVGKCRGPCQETYHPGDTGKRSSHPPLIFFCLLHIPQVIAFMLTLKLPSLVTIYPKNFPADIDALISHMNWSNIADQEVIFKGTMPDFFSPNNTLWKVPNLFPFQSAASTYTIRKLLTHHLDIMAIPKRSFFKLISNLTDDETHKARLLEFSDPAFSDDYFDYATRPRRSILEVLQEFPSVRIPWQDVTHIFPKIRGRQFSIASGGDLKANAQEGLVQFELLIAIVKYKTVLRKVRQGVCSRYIAALQPGTILNVAFESNQKFDVLARKRPELVRIIVVDLLAFICPIRFITSDFSSNGY